MKKCFCRSHLGHLTIQLPRRITPTVCPKPCDLISRNFTPLIKFKTNFGNIFCYWANFFGVNFQTLERVSDHLISLEWDVSTISCTRSGNKGTQVPHSGQIQSKVVWTWRVKQLASCEQTKISWWSSGRRSPPSTPLIQVRIPSTSLSICM